MDYSLPGSAVHGDSPGKNIGVSCHALLVIYNRKEVKLFSRVQLSATPWTVQALGPWDFPGKSPGVGCHFLLQGIFPTQGSNLGQAEALPCEPPGKPLYAMGRGKMGFSRQESWSGLPFPSPITSSI